MGVEGGGVTIYGQRVDGAWLFWQEGSSMDFSEDFDEVWRGWSSDPVPDLLAVLPARWWQMYPMEVNPEFAAQLRREYERCAGIGGGAAGQFQHARWAEMLSIGSPDTTSGDSVDSCGM
jgi:hypothetical protein